MLNRTKAPLIKDAIEYRLQLKPYTLFTLSNGVNVYTIDGGAEEVMQLELVFRAGNSYENQNLIAATVNQLLKNGTKSHSAFEINEHFEYYGSYLNRHCYNETANIVLHSLTKHVGSLLPMLRELITESEFPQRELDIYRQNMKQRLEVNLKKCDFVSNRLIDEYLFGIQHPYGKYSTAADYNALQREELVSFYEKYYVNGYCEIFVAGKLPLNLQELMEEHFGTLPLNKQGKPQVSHYINSAIEKKYRVFNDPEGVQGAVRMARHFPNRHHPDFTKVQVLNTVFGGYFGSRLMSNIREDKGYTYGIHSYLQGYMQESAWMISTEAGADVCEATVAEVYKEMEVLRKEIIAAEELLLVKNYLIGSILGDLDGPFHIIGRWKNIILNELPQDYFDQSIKIIKEISAEELQQLAEKYLQPETFYELVVI